MCLTRLTFLPLRGLILLAEFELVTVALKLSDLLQIIFHSGQSLTHGRYLALEQVLVDCLIVLHSY